MALTLAKLHGNLADVSFEYEGETVHLKYRPNVYTPAFLLNLMRLQEQEKSGGLSAETLTAVVDLAKAVLAEWDVLGDDGAPWAINDEHLRALPLDFLGALLRAITNDVSLGKQTPRL